MHSIYLGQTESGKTAFARIMARGLCRSKNVSVFDPMFATWDADYQTARAKEFDSHLLNSRSVFAFVDESGSVFGEGRDLTYAWWATRSRHWGHSVSFLGQRAQQIPRSMRDQASKIYLFTSSAEDGALLAVEWNQPIFRTCNTLPQLHFWAASRFTKAELYRINDDFSGVIRVDRTNPVPDNSRNGDRERVDLGGEVDSGKDQE